MKERANGDPMTTASHRRAQTAARGRKHRRLKKQGKAAYCVKAHEQRPPRR